MPAYPRLLFTGAQPDSGKTDITCAFLQAAVRRGLHPAAFSCGAQAGSSLYHLQAAGVKSRCLDHFLMQTETIQSLLFADAAATDLAVVEGTEGLFDGSAGTDLSSSWDLCQSTGTPAVLILRPQQALLTLAAQVKGLLQFRRESGVRALLLSGCTAAQYQAAAPLLEQETGLPCVGYLPAMPDCSLQNFPMRPVLSAAETADLHSRLDRLACQLERTVNVALLLQIAKSATALEPAPFARQPVTHEGPRIAVASDNAFCRVCTEDRELFEQLGAELLLFSPLGDAVLPPCEGLFLGGGTPEQFADGLSRNISMRESIRRAVLDGMPTLAEDGGFLYLGQSMENTEGLSRPMAGVLPGRAFRTVRPRGGCTRLTVWQDNFLCPKGTTLRAYTAAGPDTDARGADLLFQTEQEEKWTCGFAHGSLFASFASLYFLSEPTLAARFVLAAAKRRRKH